MGTYDQYHNLNSQTRESMASVWSNPYGFSVAWVGVMIYFWGALIVFYVCIRKKDKQYSQVR